ncbi:MAG: hypothetical protein R3E08_02675 [Thiotrichaceae bacterium]
MSKNLWWSVLLWCCLISTVFAAHQVLPGLSCARLNQEQQLCFMKLQEGDSQWLVINQTGDNRVLTQQPQSMSWVYDFLISPSQQWLAMISVGEGHPIIDIIELTAFLDNKPPKNLISVNPYPGSIHLDKWRGNRLMVSSDRLIHKQNQELPQVEQFYITIEDTKPITIMPLSSKLR